MNRPTSFLRSKKLWVIVFLSVTSILLIEPGKYRYSPISQEEYKVNVFGMDDSNGGKFRMDSNHTRFDIVSGNEESTVASWTFLAPKSIHLKVGVVNWAPTEKEGAAEVVFSVRQNQLVLLSNFIAHPGNAQTLVLTIDSGDVVSVEANKGTIVLEDLGFVELKEYRPFHSALVILSMFLFWLVIVLFFWEGYWLASIPIIISSLFVWMAMQAYDQQGSGTQFVWTIGYFSLVISLFKLALIPHKQPFSALSRIMLVVVLIAFTALPFSIVMYASIFGKPLETIDYFAFFQTHIEESISYLKFTASHYWILIVVFLPLLFAPLALVKRKGKQSVGVYLLSSVVLAAMASIVETPKAFRLASESYVTYTEEVDRFKESLRAFDASQAQLDVSKKEGTEIYFVVIGEAQSKFHMSHYGYVRPTTPRLDSLAKTSNSFILRNAIAPHTHTAVSLSAALTLANHVNKLQFETSPSIINVLNAADVHTHWISNQLKYGIWDNPVSVMAEQCDDQTFINHHLGKTNETSDHDGALLDVIRDQVNDLSEGSHVFFIHLMGSHTQYNKRYPKEFALFDDDDFKSLFGNLDPYEVNPYDNSIAYSDYVVAEMVRLLDHVSVERKAMFYFADHAEDLIEKHGHSSSLFNFRMIHIPSFFWFSDAYMDAYPQRIQNLEHNRLKVFTNDLVYDAIIGFTGLTTKAVNSDSFNIFSNRYSLNEDRIKILNSIDYTADDHATYHETKNVRLLANDTSISFDVFPHRVNTKGMLYEMVAKGFRGIECDLVFNDSLFEVGHGGEEYMSRNSLEDYLASSVGDSLRFIWLDLKNLRNDNIDRIVKRLLFLDQSFGIKHRVLVESDSKTDVLAKISAAGFNTSYYLPTEITQETSGIKLRAKAAEIAKLIKVQNVGSISFDAALYDWVRNELAPLIPPNTAWHTWQLDFELQYPDFNSKLREKPFCFDKRIHTVLVRVHSPYYL